MNGVASSASAIEPSSFANFMLPSIFWKPDRIKTPPWIQHIPFAFWIIPALRPRVLVELGAYAGTSYCAFCQAINTLGIETKSFAVDTWKGDEHAGFYTEEIYAELSKYHNERYSHFSTLVRSTFDEAVGGFDDGSIDLLHIDGFHTYEAVMHDFKTWLPKLSTRAVVLFHDTNVREGDFGVYKAWAELTRSYPGFEFLHGNGLGVLAVGKEIPEKIRQLMEAGKDESLADAVRQSYRRLGSHFIHEDSGDLCVQIYENHHGAFSEARSAKKHISCGINQTVRFNDAGRFFDGGLAPLRIDPANRPSVIVISSIRVLTGDDDEVAFRIESESEFDNVEFANAFAVTSEGGFMLVAPGDDAQIFLPVLPDLPGGPCALEITVKVEISRERIAEALDLVLKTDRNWNELRRGDADVRKWDDLKLGVANLQEQIANLLGQIANLKEQITGERKRSFSMQNSICWRVTAPIRWAHELVKNVAGKTRNHPEPNPAVRDDMFGDAKALSEKEAIEFKEKFRAGKEEELAIFLRGKETLAINKSAGGKVSVIIVLYNQAAFTLACLKAIAGESEFLHELIIVDNQSTDATTDLLPRVSGANVITTDENIGFLRAVNLAAKQASGKYLLLLNNDAVVRPGSLSAAIQSLESACEIGAVGGRLILPDGSLQEAGSIVWNDGSCLGYGRGSKAEAPEAMYRRDVDFCSGAFLLIRRDAFESVGGFDEEFAPAYYEETDFCMRLWENGLRVVYEPQAVVDHFEFASVSRPEEAFSLQKRNQERFRNKHARELATHQPPGLENVLRARQRNSRKGRVLVIDDLIPLPERGAGYPRAREIVNTLSEEGYFVTFWPIRAPREDLKRAYGALRQEIEIINGARTEKLEEFLREREGYYNYIFVSRPHNMADVTRVFEKSPGLFEGAGIIYDAEAVFAAREIVKARVSGTPFEDAAARKLMEVEMGYARPADSIVVVSQSEAEHFLSAGYSRVNVISHSLVSRPGGSGHGKREGFLFVGRLVEIDSPNADSILWFASQVFPRIQEELGTNVKLFVAGMIAPAVGALLKRSGVSALGKVNDLSEIYDRCRVFVAPTRYSGGIPIKVLEAAAHGLPVVATEILAEQLRWKNGEDLLASSDAGIFAEDCVRLYRDESLWNKLRDNSLARVASECDPDGFRRKLLRLFDRPPE